jgi:hypothetical protein
LSFSSCLRALCGVCAGSAKASLSAHFAKKGNLGELNAKDSSQETVISLLGMLAGSIVVSWVHSPMATWATLIALLSIHLGTNYAAVKAVSMRCLNRQRANIVFSHILSNQNAEILSPRDVSERERIFERDGVLRWGEEVIGYCRIGVSLHTLLDRVNLFDRTRTGALDKLPVKVSDLLEVFTAEGYMLWLHDVQTTEVLVVLKKDCTALDQLRAWVHALILVQSRRMKLLAYVDQGDGYAVPRLAELKHTLRERRNVFEKYTAVLRSKGWDLDVAALETRAGVRAVINAKKDI